MPQVLEREKTLLDRVQTMEPTERVERLKQRYLDTRNKLVIDLLRIRTQVMKETGVSPLKASFARDSRVFDLRRAPQRIIRNRTQGIIQSTSPARR